MHKIFEFTFVALFLLLSIIYILFQTGYFPKQVYSHFYQSQWNTKAVDSLPKLNLKNDSSEIKNIKAVIFYGRREPVSILMRYLERNVKENGGVLDKVVFAKCTHDEADLKYLESIMTQKKAYIEAIDCPVGKGYSYIYETFEDDDLIFKIDDDVVFIANGTFENMIDHYMKNDIVFLSANVINHYLLSWVHARMTAIVPFREVSPRRWEIDKTSSIDKILPNYNYATFSKWWNSGEAGAIAHESLLYHLKNNNLDLFDFKLWDFNTMGYIERWSINFVLMRGKHVNKMRKLVPKVDNVNSEVTDEVAITVELPRIYDKHSFALGSAVVSHFSYFPQFNYLYSTNILKKYDQASKVYLNLE